MTIIVCKVKWKNFLWLPLFLKMHILFYLLMKTTKGIYTFIVKEKYTCSKHLLLFHLCSACSTWFYKKQKHEKTFFLSIYLVDVILFALNVRRIFTWFVIYYDKTVHVPKTNVQVSASDFILFSSSTRDTWASAAWVKLASLTHFFSTAASLSLT